MMKLFNAIKIVIKQKNTPLDVKRIPYTETYHYYWKNDDKYCAYNWARYIIYPHKIIQKLLKLIKII